MAVTAAPGVLTSGRELDLAVTRLLRRRARLDHAVHVAAFARAQPHLRGHHLDDLAASLLHPWLSTSEPAAEALLGHHNTTTLVALTLVQAPISAALLLRGPGTPTQAPASHLPAVRDAAARVGHPLAGALAELEVAAAAGTCSLVDEGDLADRMRHIAGEVAAHDADLAAVVSTMDALAPTWDCERGDLLPAALAAASP